MRAIGVNTWVWASPLDDDALDKLARRASGFGFTALELPVENPGGWDPARARDVLDELGLVPSITGVMAPGRDLVRATATAVAATQEYLRHCVDVARTIGADVVSGPFTASTGRAWLMSAEERDDAYAELRRNLAPVVDAAGEAGVRIALEPINRYQTSLINTVYQALDALEPILGPALGLALDTYHLNIEEKIVADAVRAAAGNIASVQVSGTDRGAVGDDEFDWAGFLDALDTAEYGGPLMLESFAADNDIIATAASVWRPLAESQDALAERSLRYLSELLQNRGES